jgi:UDP-glucose 4-epimerase
VPETGASVDPLAIENLRIFITGGAGFIGSRLVGRLVENNEVVVYDNLTRNALASSPWRSHSNLRVAVGDVLDRETLRREIRGANVVIHCAAIAGIDTVGRRPVQTMTVNMVGSAEVLEAAAGLTDCRRVICFSTSEVFGQYAFSSAETDRTVIGAVGEARWTYAVSKLAEEHLAIAYHHERGLPSTVLRPFNIYGPGQVGEGALSIFIQQALKDGVLEVHGNGSQIRAWCFVEDMVDAVLLAVRSPKAVGESFNIGNRRSVETIYRLAHTVVRVLESRSEIVLVPKDEPDVELRIPAVDKALQLLGFDAKVDLEEGIRLTAEYYRGTA